MLSTDSMVVVMGELIPVRHMPQHRSARKNEYIIIVIIIMGELKARILLTTKELNERSWIPPTKTQPTTGDTISTNNSGTPKGPLATAVEYQLGKPVLLRPGRCSVTVYDILAWSCSPCIDGTALYLTRDIAGAIERCSKYSLDKMIYVVGDQQDTHMAPNASKSCLWWMHHLLIS